MAEERVGEHKNGKDLVGSVDVHDANQAPKGAFGYYGSKQRLANGDPQIPPTTPLLGGAISVAPSRLRWRRSRP